ncbi:MAG TPA: DUF4139 domain-containing protein [Flavisolibacter sp.]|nr:DUF4139 domain-containing protein [Flavisolibacter sp.]
MRKYLFFFSWLPVVSIHAQDTARAEAGLEAATVYLGYGAELVHQARVRVTPGTRTIVLSGLSTTADLNSLQIACPENVAILSHRLQPFTPPPVAILPNPAARVLEDSIMQLQKLVNRLDNQVSIEQEMLNKTGVLIETTVNTSGNKTIASAEVLKLVDYYNARIEKCKTAIFNLKEKKDVLLLAISALRSRMATIIPPAPVNAKPYGQLMLQVLCRSVQEIPVSISYYTRSAGWAPLYDIRVNGKTNKVKMVYKASLTQTTGIDWKRTKLTLSTGTPSFGVTAPELQPWQLQLHVPALYKDLQANAKLRSRSDKEIQALTDSKLVDEEVAATGYAAAPIDPSTLQQYTTLVQGQLNNNYEIDLPYDITGDGELHSVTIREREVSCLLMNYAIPKQVKESYLLARLASWQELDLLPGTANIIVDETYLGKTSIDPETTSDTLNISLGKDRRIAVSRQPVKEMTSVTGLGSNIRQVYGFEISVKNNKLTDVSIVVKDQYPLSTMKEIEVKLESADGAEVNAETGLLTWKLDLKPGESRKLRFSYSIKAPKDKRVINPK